jgi:hypothetical protein
MLPRPSRTNLRAWGWPFRETGVGAKHEAAISVFDIDRSMVHQFPVPAWTFRTTCNHGGGLMAVVHRAIQLAGGDTPGI